MSEPIKPVTTKSVAIKEKEVQKEVQKSQASYKGNSNKDRVEVEFTKTTTHHTEGDTKKVHPTVAAIFAKKGIAKLVKAVVAMLFLTLAFSSNSQVAFTHATSATLTNTGKDTMTVTVTNPLKDYVSAAIQVVITTASGTLAGTSKLYVSVDGVNFDTLYSAPGVAASSKYLTLVNQPTNTYTWYLERPYTAVKKFMIVTGGSTTVSATVNAKIIFVED